MTPEEYLAELHLSLHTALVERRKALSFKSYDIDTAGGQRGQTSQTLSDLNKTISQLKKEIKEKEKLISGNGTNRVRRFQPL